MTTGWVDTGSSGLDVSAAGCACGAGSRCRAREGVGLTRDPREAGGGSRGFVSDCDDSGGSASESHSDRLDLAALAVG